MTLYYRFSPNRTKYQDLLEKIPSFPAFYGELVCDVLVIGGGFTGLSAAYNLANNSIDCTLIDMGSFGDGASARNGGQLGTGQRRWIGNLEKSYGKSLATELLNIWFDSKKYLLEDIKAEYQPGHITAIHKIKYIDDYKKYIDDMARYGYENIRLLSAQETQERIGSKRYSSAILDESTGHINPLQAVAAMIDKAEASGAKLFEHSKAVNIEKKNGYYYTSTLQGCIKSKHILLATNGYGIGAISSKTVNLDKIKENVFPIYSYIAATEPVGDDILPNRESVDDSRFAVRYFRKEKDNSLIFGGAETYFGLPLSRIRYKVRKQILEVYPQLEDVKLTHGWGGIVAITTNRMPYVKSIDEGVFYSGGYSGHGVCLSGYMGKLYAEKIAGSKEAERKLNIMAKIKTLPFIGGKYLSVPAMFFLLNYHVIMDKL